MKKSLIKKAVKNPKSVLKKISRKYHTEIDIPMGKVFYKNTAGLRFNLKGDFTKFKTNKNRSRYYNNDNPTILELKTKGCANLGNSHDSTLIKEIQNKFNKVIEDKNCSIIRSQYGGKVYSRQLIYVPKNLPEAVNLLNEKLIDFLEKYYSGPFKVVDVYGYRNHHVPSEINKKAEMYSSRWHCDATNTSRVKLFVNLTDITDHDGPFFAQTLQRTRQLIQMGFKDRDDPGIPLKELEDPKYTLKSVGPPGTTSVCNTGICFHRATIPEQGHFRDIIRFQFEPSKEPLSEDWYNHMKEDSIRFSLNLNNVVSASIT